MASHSLSLPLRLVRGASPALIVLAAACASAPGPVGASAQPPVIATVTAPAVPETPPPPDPPVASCASPAPDEGCFPEEAYRDWLCARHDPAAAVTLFKRGTPWVRAYATKNLESWDPAGRSRAGRSQVALDEEVIVLHPYKPSAGVVVVGSTNTRGWASVDAVRADGSCVSLMAEEITMRRPPAPNHAPIAWEKLDERTRDQLLASPDLRKKAELVAKACAVENDKRCKQAKLQLTDAVVASGAKARTQG